MAASDRSSDHADEPARPFNRLAVAGLLAAAGGLHLAALPGHLNASAVAGAFFAVTAAAQLLGAVLVATRPSSRTTLAVIAGNAAVLILWAMSRTTGLPTGGELGVREPIGMLDGFAAAAEFLVVVAGLATIVRHERLAGRRSGGWGLAFGLTLTWMIFGGAGLAVAGGDHHHAGEHTHSGPASVEHSHEAPDSGGHTHDAPALGRSANGAVCPARHDCTDHSH